MVMTREELVLCFPLLLWPSAPAVHPAEKEPEENPELFPSDYKDEILNHHDGAARGSDQCA